MQSELFQTYENNSKIWEISELNASIRKTLEGSHSNVWVRGERFPTLSRIRVAIITFKLKTQYAKLKPFFSEGMPVISLAYQRKEGIS